MDSFSRGWQPAGSAALKTPSAGSAGVGCLPAMDTVITAAAAGCPGMQVTTIDSGNSSLSEFAPQVQTPLPRTPFRLCPAPHTARPATAAAVAAVATAQLPEPAAPAAAAAPPAPPAGKKPRKHGRLWRLLHGGGDTSMHQEWG